MIRKVLLVLCAEWKIERLGCIKFPGSESKEYSSFKPSNDLSLMQLQLNHTEYIQKVWNT